MPAVKPRPNKYIYKIWQMFLVDVFVYKLKIILIL